MHRFVLGLVLLAGCTRHKPLSELTDVAGHDDVYVETFAYEKIDVIAVPSPTGLDFKQVADDQHQGIDPGQIKSVVEVQRARGALQGAGLGVLAGVAGGIVFGFASGDDTCDTSRGSDMCYWTLSAGDKAFLGAIVFGGLGGLGGLIAGAIYGAHDVYDYASGSAPAPRMMPMGPPGSITGMTVTF